ncbi:unnamed protein product [Triticum turgidum subsp. durum]|uniref:Uncharacterized protein n=1 Tax=Triticum turgidum subsp. durum TaxID=4567 RepID=A0A9R0W1K3_TRITD|nr:unnamed protein product [Triticum turgidum subsp. durum]
MAPRTPQWLFRGNAVFPAEGGTHARPRAPGSVSTGATNGQRLDRRLCPARQSGQNEKEQRLWISIDSRIEGLNNERQWIPIDSLMKKEKGHNRPQGQRFGAHFNLQPDITSSDGTLWARRI